MRIVMGIEYDGTAYNGWQKQNVGIGIQTIVEAAISKVANHEINTICAGRTDAGVHAKAQIIHFDTIIDRSIHSWLAGTNSNLPDDINITWVKNVDDEFHARFSATSRTYCYQVLNQAIRSSLSRDRAWWVYEPLDLSKMRIGSEALVGRHDYTSFRAVSCQAASPIREITEIRIEQHDKLFNITISANAFLQRMVRNIVGALILIGKKEKDASWLQDVLDRRDRALAGVAAPAQGLTLLSVKYPEKYQLSAD